MVQEKSTILLGALIAAALGFGTYAMSETPDGKPVALLIAGKPSHAPGEHEHNAGVQLLAKALGQGAPDLIVKVYLNEDWPSVEDLEQADTILLYCDMGGSVLTKDDRLAQITRQMERGAGLIALHYALAFDEVAPQALAWLGGFKQLDWSVNPHWQPHYKTLPTHPVTQGVNPFSTQDEWYYHMRWTTGPGTLTHILSDIPPPSTVSEQDGGYAGNPTVRAEVAAKKPQTTAWAFERSDGGRGFGFTGGHFHRGWGNDDQRKLVLNAILWTAKVSVPANGVDSRLTPVDLEANLDPKEEPKQDASAAPHVTDGPRAPCSAAPADALPTDLFSVPDGLEVTLWAQSPQLRNPTNIDIDAQGRIWVAEGVNYREHLNRDAAGDRIVVLEDTNGDGRADKSHVFVQEPALAAPLGIAVLDNRIVVSNAPDLIVYTDVDRNLVFDAAIDKREVLLTGFGGHNHDHGLHSVTAGPDGRWYFNQGNTGAQFTDRSGRVFRAGSSDGAPELAGVASDDGHVYVGGFAVRMKPDGTDVEVIGHNFRNSYEQTVTSFGDVFQSDNDDPPACRTTFLLEYGNAGYMSLDGTRNWSADRRPGQTTAVAEWRQDDPGSMPAGDVYGGGAPTGMVFYEGDTLGKKWRGLLLSGEAARNTVFGYFPRAEGAGYRLDRFDFLSSNREREFSGADFTQRRDYIKNRGDKLVVARKHLFRPSDVAVGPDGAIYVTDWFDPRVGGHADLDDTASGAIYRIAPKGFRAVVPRLNLDTTAGQIAALESPAINVRALGYARLRAQGAVAVAPVAALLDHANPYVRARALWLLAELGSNGVSRVEAQLRAPDPIMRVTAFRALRRAGHRVLEHAQTLARDSSAAVRREVAVALRDVPVSQSRQLLLTLAEGYDGQDRTYLEAWGIGCTGKEAEVAAALPGALKPPADPVQWPSTYAGLIWRLAPPSSAGAFAARALATALSERERLAAVTALGYIATKEGAQGMLEVAEQGSDQVKRHALWWLLNYKDVRWQAHGLDEELKRRRLYDPDKAVLTEMIVPPAPASSRLPPAAEIAKLTGDVRRGAEFARACQMCHRIGTRGIDYGPDLSDWAKYQAKEAVIGAILDPSADIAHGYEGEEIITKDGITIHGLVLAKSKARMLQRDPVRIEWTGNPTVVQSTGGMMQLIPPARIASMKSLDRSLMLGAEQLGLEAQDVADIAAYLAALQPGAK